MNATLHESGAAGTLGHRAATLSLWSFVFLFARVIHGQPSLETQQAFLDLSHDEVLMDLSAHPDDEDGATLAYYRMKFGIKTYSVLFTRGEGGQNETGPELYEELGVLRTAETRAAGKILGTEVYFLNFLDFGFSKTATETFRIWGGQEEALRRLVYIIRKLKPDVMFTNHNMTEGHGNHQAVAITAIAAFDAAADSTIFPEQLKEPGLALWQPRKLFFRNFGRGDRTADVANNINEVDPLRKLSYLDIATQALRMHKTQGLDRANLRAFTRGLSLYKLVRQNSIYEGDSTSFFSGIELWSDPGLAPLRPIRARISSMSMTGLRDATLQTVSTLFTEIDSASAIASLTACGGRILRQWESELEHLSRALCSLNVSLTLKDQVVVPKQRVECALELSSDNSTLADVRSSIVVPRGWSSDETPGVLPEKDDRHFKREYTILVADSPILTLPKASAQYRPIEGEQNIVAHAWFTMDGIALRTSCSPEFEVAPPQLLTISPKVAHIDPLHLGRGTTFYYSVKNYLPHKTAGKVKCIEPAGWRSEPSAYAIGAEDSTASDSVVVTPPGRVNSGEYPLKFTCDFWTDDATARVFAVNVRHDMDVGIIKSYDTTLEAALKELGVRYRLLGPKDIETGDLSKYATILVDIRAYLVRDDLRRSNGRLLDYVRSGGNLVVMYQRDQEWKPEYAPFPFRISRRRVTVEEAPIEVLSPKHPLFTAPNLIVESDWSGWKQERGLYFPADVAPEYTQLLSTHDPDEPPLTTGYMVASAGKGSYIYTSLVWYRQLKEMNPGAFRCFANMISYPSYRK